MGKCAFECLYATLFFINVSPVCSCCIHPCVTCREHDTSLSFVSTSLLSEISQMKAQFILDRKERIAVSILRLLFHIVFVKEDSNITMSQN
jgi:hypothetical protein